MKSAIWFLMFAGTWPLQEDPSPRFEVRLPDDRVWELADDYSGWLRHLLSGRRHREFEQSLETAISKFREPYAALFRTVRDRHRWMVSVPASPTPDHVRAHEALERIRLMKLLGGFEEMIADITAEMSRKTPLWQILGGGIALKKELQLDLAWAQFRAGDFEAGEEIYRRFTSDANVKKMRDDVENGRHFEERAVLSAFRWLRRELGESRDSQRTATLTFGLRGVLGSAHDRAGQMTLETRLLNDPDTPAWPKVEVLKHRASEAYAQGEYSGYVRILGDALATYPQAPQYHELLLARARALMILRRYGDARLGFEEWLKAFDQGKHSQPQLASKGVAAEVQRLIAISFASEHRWKEAHAAYLEARDRRPRESFCGNCNGSMRLEDEMAVSRCLARMGFKDEALAIIDRLKPSADMVLAPWFATAFVEASFGGPREQEFRKRLGRIAGSQSSGYHGDTAPQYFAVYRAELQSDAAALFDRFTAVFPNPSKDFQAKRPEQWDENLQWHRWVAREALDRLNRLPDTAIPLLVERIKREDKTAEAALLALAYMNHEKSIWLFQDLEWIPESRRGTFLDVCVRISARWASEK